MLESRESWSAKHEADADSLDPRGVRGVTSWGFIGDQYSRTNALPYTGHKYIQSSDTGAEQSRETAFER